MRIALTGATGFAGRHILSHLLGRGHEVRAWFRGDTRTSTPGVDWVPGNLNDDTAVIGSLRLIDAAEKAGSRRFVFISSGAVHQQAADDLPLDERHPLWPASLYGASKASVETLVSFARRDLQP